MPNNHEAVLVVSSYPGLLTNHVMQGLADDSMDAFQIEFFAGGVRIDQLRGEEWTLADQIDRNSDRIHQAYEIARGFGWDDLEQDEELLATRWRTVVLKPASRSYEVWLRKTEEGEPKITFWIKKPPLG